VNFTLRGMGDVHYEHTCIGACLHLNQAGPIEAPKTKKPGEPGWMAMW
jgi:hypothetical protein